MTASGQACTILGRRIENGARTVTVSGVVRNSLYESFGELPTPMLYFSYRDRPATTGEIHVLSGSAQSKARR